MKKVITLLLSIFLGLLTLFGAGCTSYYQTPTGDSSSKQEETSSGEEIPEGEGFSVTLRTTDGGKLPSLEGVYAQWTEINGANVYRAPFDSDGVARSSRPDGEYRVTLSTTPTGYTYNPNVYYADNVQKDKVIELYPLRGLSGGDGSNVYEQVYKIITTGAYRFTFENARDEIFFLFGASYSGEMTFESLLDVTANEVLPVFYKWNSSNNQAASAAIVGGGAANSYTKNFYCSVALTDSQDQAFKIGVETVNSKAFPITIDVLIQKVGEYTLPEVELTTVEPPANLKDFSNKNAPTRNFTLMADTNGKVLDETLVIYDETDDRFYQKDANGEADKTKMLYAMLKKDIPGIVGEGGDSDSGGLSNPLVRHVALHSKKDYTQFINAYFPLTNRGGSYPLTAALKEYLYDFSVANKLFYDGLGRGETAGYNSNTPSQWLFACGYYL